MSVERFLRSWLTKEGAILVPVDLNEWFPSTCELVGWKTSAAYISITEGDIFDIPTCLCDWFCNLRAHLYAVFVFKMVGMVGEVLLLKVIVQKGTKPWSKINSHVNNMYFTLKSPRYVALSFRHGG